MLTLCVGLYRSFAQDAQAFNTLPKSGPSPLVGVKLWVFHSGDHMDFVLQKPGGTMHVLDSPLSVR